jgi:hypothetical protein
MRLAPLLVLVNKYKVRIYGVRVRLHRIVSVVVNVVALIQTVKLVIS